MTAVELKVRNSQGQVVGTVEVKDSLFDVPMNAALVHQVAVGQMANRRQGTHKTKTRAEVSGGGIKPRPQKYTGRSRQGSIRAPQWKGGGIVFGPVPRSYRHDTPKRMRRLSLAMVLSDKVREELLVVVDKLDLGQSKTKEMMKVLETLGARQAALLVADGADSAVLKAARNLPELDMLPASLLNTLDLLRHRKVIMTLDALRKAEELWGEPQARNTRQQVVAAEG